MNDKTDFQGSDQRQNARALGCAAWATIVSIGMFASMYFLLSDIYSWELGRGSLNYSKNLLSSFLFIQMIVVVIAILFGVLIGKYTKSPWNRRNTVITFLVIVTGVYTFLVAVWIEMGRDLSEGWPASKPLTQMPINLLATVFVGMILGLIAGYGYWSAGRRYNKEPI